ncbi:MAG: tyrosine-type recombinase/integrase [Bryobacterales bacterium]|nr:tyrosine-type recombinase/integrase [Bryobacterales bacterium]
MLTLYRRHVETCPHRHKGREWTKCDCPIHCDGMVGGRRVRLAMDTVNWDRARRRLGEIEDDAASGKIRKPVKIATEAFMQAREVGEQAERKYKRIMKRLLEFCQSNDISTVDRIRLEHLDDYKAGRKLSKLSWSKELQLLRTFFEFCRKRKWCEENVAKDMEMPSDPKPKERRPYTAEEVARIIAACDTFGKVDYERRRARAMILLMRYYGLRVSDVATLERDRVRNGEIFVTAMKNGQQLWLPLYPDIQFALEALPLPMGADPGCRYFFWTGKGSRFGHIKTVDRTLQAVFRESGVEQAHAHKFRHTLATEILVKGGTAEDAANILGDSPAIIRKHYAKWSADYQHRTVQLLGRIHGTVPTQRETTPISPLFREDKLVLEVGVEPT